MLAWILLCLNLNELDNIKILQVVGDSEASLLQRSLQGAVEGLCPVRVNTDHWQHEFLAITLASVVLININGAIFQGGLLGLVGRFPAPYMNAVLNGLVRIF